MALRRGEKRAAHRQRTMILMNETLIQFVNIKFCMALESVCGRWLRRIFIGRH